MQDFFAADWQGPAFQLFGTYHLIALAIILLINLSLIKLRGSSEQIRRMIRYSLSAVLIIDELAWHAWNMYAGAWNIQNMLPLHLCSILVWLSAFMLVFKNYPIYEFTYLLGIPGALQALITPDAGMYGFPHFRSIQVMLSHGSIITAAMYMTIVEGFRPTPRSLVRLFTYGNLYMAVVFILNLFIGSNYLFIAHKPVTASLLDFLPPWPWYIGIIELLGIAFVLLLYLPFFIMDQQSKRSNPPPSISLPSGEGD